MIKSILCGVALSFSAWAVQAQNQMTSDSPIQKNDISVSLNLGVGSYIGMSAPKPNLSEYSLSAPMSGWFDKKLMLDLEGRWFVSETWALKLTGGFIYSNNPGHDEVLGTESTDMGSVPTYKAVPNSDNIQYAFGLGVDKYLSTKNRNLFFRIGGEVGFAYGKVTAKADTKEYMGASVAEAYAYRIAPLVGMDYYFADDLLFIGIDVRPVAYQYSTYKEKPQSGLKALSSNNHTVAFISQPMIKFGVKF